MAEMHLVAAAPLRAAMRTLVKGCGSSDAEAATVADNLVDANLAGHDSHGIGMLPRYVGAVREGGLKVNAHVSTVLDAGALLRLDGNAGFGQVVGGEAMALGIERAKSLGCAIVALGNAHHLGRIGAWAEMAVAAGMVSLHFVNVLARPIVAPHGGAKAGFGTNPFTAGIPLAGRPPMILDFATSTIAQGKTRVAFNKGEPVPEGCLIDENGRATTDPRWTVQPPWGALIPFGAHKGSGLAVLCELLGGALAAGLVGHQVDGVQQRVMNGMLSVIIDPRALHGSDAWEKAADEFLDGMLKINPREGFDRVMLAGDPERRTREQRLAQGLPVDKTTWQQILDAAQSVGLDPQALQRSAGLA
jgi:uncharacterized oxidoreductase